MTWNTALTDVSSTQDEELGIFRFENSKVYQYVLAGGAITQYDWVKASGTTGTTIVPTAQTTGINDPCMGASQVAMTSAYYGWIQREGAGTVKKDTDYDCASGDALMGGTQAGCCKKLVTNAGISGCYGVALAAATTTVATVTALIKGM